MKFFQFIVFLRQRFLVGIFLPGMLSVIFPTQGTAAPSFFQCGGELENDIWRQWDSAGKKYLAEQLIDSRLIAQGDTYALYDFETTFHNLLAMAQRCQRIDRQIEMKEMVRLSYRQLTEAPEQAWICRGGPICNEKNQLIDREVMLNSVQFLAFSTSLANMLGRSKEKLNNEKFARETARIALSHLRRWDNIKSRKSLTKRISAKPKDVKNGSSDLFLTDKDLWRAAIYAEMAGLLVEYPKLKLEIGLADDQFDVLAGDFKLLMKLIGVRITQTKLQRESSQQFVLAELDRGFWRLYADSHYAGYEGATSPVRCVRKSAGYLVQKKMQEQTEFLATQPIDSVGWDISHARRLVHFFDAIERNRAALGKIFALQKDALPSPEVMGGFARQLHARVWNQDNNRPLFTNFMNGANGWYRVAYENGTGQCREGTPPFGLTSAFATGGYATWRFLEPELGSLGERLYELARSESREDKIFIDRYYPNLGRDKGSQTRLISETMFWPSLVRSQ